jgi:hypothetical protein
LTSQRIWKRIHDQYPIPSGHQGRAEQPLSSVRPLYRHTKAARELSRAACAMNCRDCGGRVRFRSSIVRRIMRLSDLFDSCFLNSGRHFLDMRPAPSQNPPGPPVSVWARSCFAFQREKTRIVARLGRAGRPQGAQPDEVMRCCAPAGLRVGGGSARKQCPPGQNRDPLAPPPSRHPQVPLSCIDSCVFRPRF